MSIEAVLFDLDGVLIDAREWHYESLNRALKLFGYEISRYDHLNNYDGLPTAKKLHLLTQEGDLPKSLHSFINRMKQIYTMEIIGAKCRPVFTHRYALSRLRAEGLRLAVCSNSIRATMEAMLSHSALLEYLEFYLSNQDIKNPKPDPEIYTTAMGRLGLQPEQCVIVEDNVNGIKAAMASGGRVLRVRDPSDVTYAKISDFIKDVEQGNYKC